MLAFHPACREGDFPRIKRLQAMIQPVLAAMAGEPEPVMLKAAMALSGHGFDEAVRLPLVPVAMALSVRLRAALAELLAAEAALRQVRRESAAAA